MLFQQLCKGLGIQMRLTSSYYPQSDGAVEGCNQAILEGLRAKLLQEKDWAVALAVRPDGFTSVGKLSDRF